MPESTKTLTFAGTALAVLLLALFVSRPQHLGDALPADLNQPFFPDFDDPLKAKSLEIVDFNEETGERSDFLVSQDAKGVWSIPSHGGYPADAEKQLAQAAASVIDLKKGSLESNDPKLQEEYGVVAPPSGDANSEKKAASGQGVGKLVIFKDKGGNVLAQFIIGKEVKNPPVAPNPEGPRLATMRYVRVPGTDPIYSTSVNVSKLSTKFDDWIEKDLLKMKLATYSIKEVVLKNDTVNVEQRVIEKGPVSLLGFESKDSKWFPIDLEVVDKTVGKMVERKLQDDEEIDNQKLNDMKTAMNDLRIADVQRKPAGLSADLEANQEFLNNQQSLMSLNRRGFYPASINNQVGLFSKEGEVRCRMNDGVEYVLRFGGIAGRGKAEDLEEDKPQDDKPGDEKKPADDKSKKPAKDQTADARRFLFVAVEFNQDMIPKPELAALPPEETKAPAEDAKVFGPNPDAKAAESKKDATDGAKKKDDADKKESDKKESDEKESDKKEAADKPADEAKADDKKADDKKEDDKKPDAPAEEKKPVNPERDRVEKENKQKQDDYDEKVKKGRQRVAELNRRFADWYYVIADKTFQKIHLTQADIIKKKTPPATSATDPLPQNPGDPFLKGLPAGLMPPGATIPPAATSPATPPAETTPATTPAAPAAPAKNNPPAPKAPTTPPGAKSATPPAKKATPPKATAPKN